jgi:hypothetical protein
MPYIAVLAVTFGVRYETKSVDPLELMRRCIAVN